MVRPQSFEAEALDHSTLEIMPQYFFRFVVIVASLFAIAYTPWVHQHLVNPFTSGIAQFTGALLQLFGANVTVYGNTLSIPEFSIQVMGLCNGVEATLILWSALLAFPAPWKYRLKGILIGALAIHSINILRIISLLYIGAYKRVWFEFTHVYLWEVLIMLDILLVFLIWLRFAPRPLSREGTA